MNKKVLIIALLVVVIIVAGTLLFVIQKAPQEPAPTTYTYHGFQLPFELSDQEVSESIMTGNAIKVYDVSEESVDEIDKMAISDGWQKIHSEVFLDGGSTLESYFKNKNTPGVELFYKWDMSKGRHEYLSVRFIHPASLGSWLIKIRSKKVMTGEIFDVEKLMECDGIIAQTYGDSTECVKIKK